MTCEVLRLLDGLGESICLAGPEVVAGQFVHIPQRAGKESAAPVFIIAIEYLAVFCQRDRVQNLSAAIDNFQFIAELYLGISDDSFDQVYIRVAAESGRSCRQERQE